MCGAHTHRPPPPSAARRAPPRIPSGRRRSTAAVLRTIGRQLCLWALHSQQNPTDGTPGCGWVFVVSAVLEWGLGMRGAHTYSGKLGFHYSGRWHTLTDPDGRFFVDPDPHSRCTQPREPTTHPGTEREVARARARRARAWGLGGADRHPGEVEVGDQAPKSQNFAAPRARRTVTGPGTRSRAQLWPGCRTRAAVVLHL